MKIILLVCFLSVVSSSAGKSVDGSLDSEWEFFKNTYNKLYSTRSEEQQK